LFILLLSAPQPQYQIINPNQPRTQLAPTTQITSSSTPPPNMPQVMVQQAPSQVPTSISQQQQAFNEDDMRYNAKINELSAYIPLLENVLANQASNTSNMPPTDSFNNK
jgi:hypothetical protein